MKRVLICLWLVSGSCLAQTVVNIYDNNGNEVGQPSITSFQYQEHYILRPDAIAVRVNFRSGILGDVTNFIWFAELDCQGTPYATLTSPPVFSWITPIESQAIPKPLVLISQGANVVTIDAKSRAVGSPSGCFNNISISQEAVYPVTFIDGTDYGLEITPSGEWGYAPPLTAKATKVSASGETIFCNGFESCPASE